MTDIGSPYIRQRLLEQGSLDLAKTVEVAESLETASHYLEAYSADHVDASLSSQLSTPLYTAGPHNCATMRQIIDPTSAAAPGGPRCYFCGLRKHPRQRCPVREVFCSACGKKGHYTKVC